MKWEPIETAPGFRKILFLWADGRIESGEVELYPEYCCFFLSEGRTLFGYGINDEDNRRDRVPRQPEYWAEIGLLPDGVRV